MATVNVNFRRSSESLAPKPDSCLCAYDGGVNHHLLITLTTTSGHGNSDSLFEESKTSCKHNIFSSLITVWYYSFFLEYNYTTLLIYLMFFSTPRVYIHYQTLWYWPCRSLERSDIDHPDYSNADIDHADHSNALILTMQITQTLWYWPCRSL